MKHTLLTLLLALPLAAISTARAEDPRVQQLQIDVAQLQRELLAQSRRIEALEHALARSGQKVEPSMANAAPAMAAAPPPWINAANWQRIHPGMSELEVMTILGPPTTVRTSTDGETRTLFYALEIGKSSFLAGNIELAPDKVRTVNKPQLR